MKYETLNYNAITYLVKEAKISINFDW